MQTQLSHRAMLLASVVGGILIASPCIAQQKEDAADKDEIVVTAQKRSENLQDVPVAITAIGTEKLDQLQVNELQDVVKFLPSVTIQTSTPGFAQVYFRGVASGENANHSASLPTVGTYLDEMPITTIQGALDLHSYDLARVEALAGPQGTLYGASSMAGTIRLITNQPDASGTYGEAGVELNRVAHGDFGVTYEGFLNARLSDSAAARIVGWYRKDGGYIDNIAGSRTYPTSGITQNNATFVEKNYNDVDTYGARLALKVDLDENWTLKPTFMGQIQKSNGSFAQERGKATVGRKLETIQYNPENGNDKWIQAGLTIEGKIGNWDLTATTGHLRRKATTNSDYSDYAFFYDSLFGSGAFFIDNNAIPVNPNQFIEATDRYKRSFGELRIASPSDASIRLIGGLFYQRQVHNIEQNYIVRGISDAIKIPGTASNIWLTKQERVDRDYAAFGELAYDLVEKLTITAGGRYYKYNNSLIGFFGLNYPGFSSNAGYACIGPAQVDGTPCTNLGTTTPSGVVPKRTKGSGFSPKINITYKFNDDALLYATWSRGFRPGGINRRGTLPPYGPDTLDNYEIGWKTNFGPVRLNGAIYQENWSNVQLSILGANGLTQIQNAGNARIRGIEIDAGYRSGGFTFNIGGSYNNAKLTFPFCATITTSVTCATPAANITLAPKGARLPVTAKFKGNAIMRYEFALGSWDAHVQMAGQYTGKRKNDLRTIENSIVGDQKTYATADLSFGIKNDLGAIELFATNVFGSNGVIGSGVQCLETTCGDPGNISASGGVFYDTVIKPRIIGLKVSHKF